MVFNEQFEKISNFQGNRIRKVLLVLLAVALIVAAYSFRKEQPVTRSDERQTKQSSSGKAAFKSGDFKVAIVKLEKAVELSPRDAGNRNVLGSSYEAVGRLDEALKSYLASLEIDPKQADILYRVALIHKHKGQKDKAMADLTECLEIDRNYVAAKLALAELYTQADRKEEARELYQNLLKESPFGLDLGAVKAKLQALK